MGAIGPSTGNKRPKFVPGIGLSAKSRSWCGVSVSGLIIFVNWLPLNQSRHGGTVQGSAPRTPAIKDATAGLLRCSPASAGRRLDQAVELHIPS